MYKSKRTSHIEMSNLPPKTPQTQHLHHPAIPTPRAVAADPRILPLRKHEMLRRQQNRLINRHGQPAVPTTQHHRTQHQLAQRMPATRETIRLIRQAGAQTHGAVGTHGLEDDVERGVRDRMAGEVARLDDADDDDGEGDPPEIVGELGAQLLLDEVQAARGRFLGDGAGGAGAGAGDRKSVV